MIRAGTAGALILILTLGIGGCFDPSDDRPGLRLRGEPAAVPSSWSFADAQREIAVEVRTPHWLPHSVTIWCVTVEGDLYVGARNPDRKRWVAWVERDAEVRLRIGSQLYEVRLEALDESRLAAVRNAYADKYGLTPSPAEAATAFRYWRVVPRS